jgi:hypothetical protein
MTGKEAIRLCRVKQYLTPSIWPVGSLGPRTKARTYGDYLWIVMMKHISRCLLWAKKTIGWLPSF